MRNAGTEYFTAFDSRLSTIAATSTRSPERPRPLPGTTKVSLLTGRGHLYARPARWVFDQNRPGDTLGH
jgi:hypothetical protein